MKPVSDMQRSPCACARSHWKLQHQQARVEHGRQRGRAVCRSQQRRRGRLLCKGLFSGLFRRQVLARLALSCLGMLCKAVNHLRTVQRLCSGIYHTQVLARLTLSGLGMQCSAFNHCGPPRSGASTAMCTGKEQECWCVLNRFCGPID